MDSFVVSGNIVDILKRKVFPGLITVSSGKITSIGEEPGKEYPHYIMPGFIDAHVHIESSMLIPSEFARLATPHGTVATVSDPHEIANVSGKDGVRFMLENGKAVPMKFNFGAPSCVPATPFETAGAVITADDVKELLAMEDIKYLSEMMNYPGVLSDNPEVFEKLNQAKKLNIPIDGHAPGLGGQELRKYVSAGITTDHECLTLAEAEEKIALGMKILIREGSAAKNFDILAPLISKYPEMVMLCSDDKHPDDLVLGHINLLVKRAIDQGHNFFDVMQAATANAIKHYHLDVGMLQPGDAADFIVVNDLRQLKICKAYINGELVAEDGVTRIASVPVIPLNNFRAEKKALPALCVKPRNNQIRVICAKEGHLETEECRAEETVLHDSLVSKVAGDVLKIVVVNRYENKPPAIGFVKGFGFKRGAIASSIGHDSHNVIAVGATDADILLAVNAVIEAKGGMALADGDKTEILKLPIAGLMTAEDGYKTAKLYALMNCRAKELGTDMAAPFMTLSFMALLVIPKLKLSDKGLFSGTSFEFVDLHVA